MFELGQLVFTRLVNDAVAENNSFAILVTTSLKRHSKGDWGDLDSQDKKENDLSVKQNFRILSSYKVDIPGLPNKVWIITEADRSATTVLFPEEY